MHMQIDSLPYKPASADTIDARYYIEIRIQTVPIWVDFCYRA